VSLLPVHIPAGLIGIVTGFVALAVTKGGSVHRKAGLVFTVAMLVMACTGVVLASIKLNGGNIMGGAVAIYMVTTAFLAVRRPPGGVDRKDVLALVLGLAIVVAAVMFATQAAQSPNGRRFGYSPALYIVFGSITSLGVLGDARMLIARGVHGTAKIARHLWRMCFSMFIATGSFFLGQSQVFPKPIRILPLLAVPVVLVIALMLFWLVRVRVTRRFHEPDGPAGLPGTALGPIR